MTSELKLHQHILMSIMQLAGLIARKFQSRVTHKIKPDMSIVTEADHAISRLLKKTLHPLLQSGDHMIIDEESFQQKAEVAERLKSTQYAWIVDPIDGTIPYFNGLPFWAIAVGVYKKRKPYLSAIYLPALNNMLYFDGVTSYFVSDPFTPNERRKKLKPPPSTMHPASTVFALHDRQYASTRWRLIDVYCAYLAAYYTLTGCSAGAFFQKPMGLWDITATLPIAQSLGLQIINARSGKNLTDLSVTIVDEQLKLNDIWVLCHKKNFSELITIINPSG